MVEIAGVEKEGRAVSASLFRFADIRNHVVGLPLFRRWCAVSAIAVSLILFFGGTVHADTDPLARARQYVDYQKYDKAIPLLESYYGHNPESTEAYYLLLHALRMNAVVAYDEKDYGTAIVSLVRAVQLAPTDTFVKRDLATVYTAYGYHLYSRADTPGAEEAFRKALEIIPTSRAARRGMARIEEGKGDAEREAGRPLIAIHHYRSALEWDSTSIAAHLALGQIYYRREEFALARQHLKKARELSAKTIKGLDDLLARVDREEEETRLYETIEADGFRVRFRGAARYELFNQILPILQEARQRASFLFERTPRKPLTVILYTGEAFSRAVAAPDWATGLYDGKVRLRESEVNRPVTYLTRVIRHEVAHAVLNQVCAGDVPAWIHEGIAKYLEIDQWDSLQDASYLVTAIKRKEWIDLWRLEKPFTSLPGDSDVRLAYDESAAAIRFLATNYGQRAIADLVTLLSAGRSPAEAIDNITFLDRNVFQSRVRDWVLWEYDR